jgi:hypothetical protein
MDEPIGNNLLKSSDRMKQEVYHTKVNTTNVEKLF